MQRKITKCMTCRWFVLLCVILTLEVALQPLTAEASWINRSDSGIYYQDGEDSGLGQGIGELDENSLAEEEEVDEGSGFFLDLINTILCWILSTIGRALFSLLDLVGASLDQLIYGRLVAENTLFSFDLGEGNIYGIVSSAIYNILASVVIGLLIPVFTGKVVLSAWKRGDFARSSLKEALSYFVLSLLVLVLMPYFLDTMLFVRDVVLYIIGTEGATTLFGTGSSTSIVAVLGASANDNIVSGVVYVAAVLLNLYFLIGYVGIALSMTANFILFPLIVVKMPFDKQVLKNWIWEMISCMFVPIIDAVLIMIPSFLGIYAAEITFLDAVGVSVVQLIICYLIIPIRTYSRGVLGMRLNPLENSGLAAASFMGMAAARGIKNAFSESREAKKNAELDRERADAEEDLAQLEKEEEAESYAAQAQTDAASIPSAEDIRQMIDAKNGKGDLPDLAKEREEQNPLGQEQNYAEGIAAHIAATNDEDVPLPKEAALSTEERMQNAKKLEALDQELEEANRRKSDLEAKKNALLKDESMNPEEKAEQLAALDNAIAEQEDRMEDIEWQREAVMSVDDKIRAAYQRRSQLEEEYQETANAIGLDAEMKEEKLEAFNEQIREVDQEIAGLQRQKQKLQVEQEKSALAKEPATLRRELANLKTTNETLNLEREELVRQRNTLKAEQGNYAVGTSEHEALGERIYGLNHQIRTRDRAISENVLSQNTISDALAKQESGLHDRQAYNLHERVKAQSDYENAKSRADNIQQRLAEADAGKVPFLAEGTPQRRKMEQDLKAARQDMSKAEERIGELSREDRRIAARLHEISPDLNQPSVEELKEAKRAQAVKKAAIQKEIAAVQEQLENDRENTPAYRSQIAKLQSEVADCNYASARLDQMIEGMSGGAVAGHAKSGGHSTATNVSSEYERKRAAIMERYANIDNFERPEFSGISREKRAQLYRERAMRTQQVFTKHRLAGAAGAVAGGAMGIWFGSAGVASGALVGHALGSELGTNSALRHMEKITTTNAVDYTDKPLDFHISADYRDNTYSGQQRTIERVQAELAGSLESDRFQTAVQEELENNNLIKKEIKVLFKKHRVNAENYNSKRDVLVRELHGQVVQSVENAEARIVQQCAGQEYAKLSDEVKKKIVRNVVKPNMEVFYDLCESQYLCPKWEPYYEEYLDD